MSAVKRIKQSSLRILGCEAEPWDDVWKRVKELSKAFSETQVVAAFDEWAEIHQGQVITRPVAEFLKTAPGQLKGTFSLKENSDLKEFVNELSYLSDNEITFDKEQQRGISKLLASYSKEEIKNAFIEYYDSLDGDRFLIRTAGAKFPDKAEQFIYGRRKRMEKEQQTLQLVENTIAQQRAKAEAEIAAQPKPIDFDNIEL